MIPSSYTTLSFRRFVVRCMIVVMLGLYVVQGVMSMAWAEVSKDLTTSTTEDTNIATTADPCATDSSVSSANINEMEVLVGTVKKTCKEVDELFKVKTNEQINKCSADNKDKCYVNAKCSTKTLDDGTTEKEDENCVVGDKDWIDLSTANQECAKGKDYATSSSEAGKTATESAGSITIIEGYKTKCEEIKKNDLSSQDQDLIDCSVYDKWIKREKKDKAKAEVREDKRRTKLCDLQKELSVDIAEAEQNTKCAAVKDKITARIKELTTQGDDAKKEKKSQKEQVEKAEQSLSDANKALGILKKMVKDACSISISKDNNTDKTIEEREPGDLSQGCNDAIFNLKSYRNGETSFLAIEAAGYKISSTTLESVHNKAQLSIDKQSSTTPLSWSFVPIKIDLTKVSLKSANEDEVTQSTSLASIESGMDGIDADIEKLSVQLKEIKKGNCDVEGLIGSTLNCEEIFKKKCEGNNQFNTFIQDIGSDTFKCYIQQIGETVNMTESDDTKVVTTAYQTCKQCPNDIHDADGNCTENTSSAKPIPGLADCTSTFAGKAIPNKVEDIGKDDLMANNLKNVAITYNVMSNYVQGLGLGVTYFPTVVTEAIVVQPSLDAGKLTGIPESDVKICGEGRQAFIDDLANKWNEKTTQNKDTSQDSASNAAAIKALEDEITTTEKNIKDNKVSLETKNKELAALTLKWNEMNGKTPKDTGLEDKQKEIDSKNSEIKELTSQITSLEVVISDRIAKKDALVGNVDKVKTDIDTNLTNFCGAVNAVGDLSAYKSDSDASKNKQLIVKCLYGTEDEKKVDNCKSVDGATETFDYFNKKEAELRPLYWASEIKNCDDCSNTKPQTIGPNGMCCADGAVTARSGSSVMCCNKNNISTTTLECCPAGVSTEGECIVNNYGQMGIYCSPDQLINGTCRLETYKLRGIRKSNQKPDVGLFIGDIVLAATSFIGTVVTIALLVSGFKYVMAATGGGKIDGAATGVKYSLIALFLVAFSYAIIRLVQYIAKG